jgi:hypothetical protein
MKRNFGLPWMAITAWLATAPALHAQVRPYIGFVYPAGGQQGTTIEVRLGGQGLDGVSGAVVSGPGVSAHLVDYYRRLNNQDVMLLREQLNELKKGARDNDEPAQRLIQRLEKRLAEHVQTPACAAIANLAFVEITIAADAPPGRREIRLLTPRGPTNPLVFHIGQVPEVARKPMISASLQVLGKEESALRKRPDEEIEQRIEIPCTANGQIASGEINRYRFSARKGQRLVISVTARRLVPYIADAVPGWFQAVIALYNAQGKELAYCDDYRFHPDPLLFFQVPEDGEYVVAITDALYRGREDFVYRLTIGELPFLTGIFPLGTRSGVEVKLEMQGWNLEGASLSPPAKDAPPGIYWLTATTRQGLVSNPLPFAVDDLPECLEHEPNNAPDTAQKVSLPIIVNGRIERPGESDVFQFEGRAGEAVVAEVYARRLESPLDAMLRLTDASGKLVAFNDDWEDVESGLNTHHADSFLMATLPADGTYFVHLSDVARHGGEAYGYRLRISAPRPDFALRAIPASLGLRGKSTATATVRIIRKEGFAGPVKLQLKNPPEGFAATPVTVPANQELGRLTVRTTLTETEQPVSLRIEGVATIGEREVVREAVPAEDRMQAFFWRHLVPAEDLQATVADASTTPPPQRGNRPRRKP